MINEGRRLEWDEGRLGEGEGESIRGIRTGERSCSQRAMIGCLKMGGGGCTCLRDLFR